MSQRLSLLRPLLLLVALTSLCCLGDNKGSTICDDGEYEVERDLGGDSNWKCNGIKFPAKAFYFPAGVGYCNNTHPGYQPECIQESLTYQEQPPSQGFYRHVAPRYGEYKYLPPQRWLHTLKTGGVAFLYHPCADPDQVRVLRDVAHSCLNMYVVTPYPNLTQDYPFAVVTWGCVYNLGWIDPPEVKSWLLARGVSHALGTESSIYYDRDLQTPAQSQQFPSLCPNITVTVKPPPDVSPHESTSASSPTPSGPCSNRSGSPSPQSPGHRSGCVQLTVRVKTLQQHGLTVLIALLGVVLLGFTVLLLFKAASVWGRKRPRNQRYKTVSRYFPFSYEKQVAEVVIPEVGMPKSGSAERQVLLNASDEDEL